MKPAQKFNKGQIVTLVIDSVIQNEILSVKWNNEGECWNYKVRQFSKYGEHGKKEYSESSLQESGSTVPAPSCDCTHTQACAVCADEKDIDWNLIETKKLAAKPGPIVLVIIDPSGKKVSLSVDTRQKYYENHEVMSSIKVKISERINREFESECKDMKSENDLLYKKECRFRDLAKQMLVDCTTETKLRVSTQVGKNASVIKTYEGHLRRVFKKHDGTFDFISAEYNDGNPFTIGFSCLQSIELIP